MHFLVWLGVSHPVSRAAVARPAASCIANPTVLSVPQALKATLGWIVVALGFAMLVYGLYEYRWFDWDPGAERSVRRTRCAHCSSQPGYVLEWSLSVDNIFVIALIFTYLKVTAEVSVPGPVLGHRRCDHIAWRDDRDRRRADPRIRLDVLRVRRNPAAFRACAC